MRYSKVSVTSYIVPNVAAATGGDISYCICCLARFLSSLLLQFHSYQSGSSADINVLVIINQIMFPLENTPCALMIAVHFGMFLHNIVGKICPGQERARLPDGVQRGRFSLSLAEKSMQLRSYY